MNGKENEGVQYRFLREVQLLLLRLLLNGKNML